MPLKKILPHLKTTPQSARYYLLFAALLIALPSIASLYKGHGGKFLVATGRLGGTVFEDSVIYLNHHDFWGAHGIIINKPVHTREFHNKFPELEWNVKLYNGGPVRYARDNFLLLPTNEAENGFLVFPVEAVKKEKPDLIKMLEEKENKKPLHLYSGYAGWGPLQLNREISTGAWGVIEYDPALMFDTPPEEIWKKAMERVLESRPAKSGGV